MIYIPAEEAKRLGLLYRTDLRGLMLRLLDRDAPTINVPISNFSVRAVAAGSPVGDWANLYWGANMEFRGHAVNFSLHAEQAAVNNAWLHGETALQAIACTSQPCGLCRQFLAEIGTDLDVLVWNREESEASRYRLYELLPHAFGPSDLGKPGGMLTPQYHPMKLMTEKDNPLAQAAFEAACQSYAPYTGCFAGCALEDRYRRVYVGRYAENAAFNPSLSAIHSAVSTGALASDTFCYDIRRAALAIRIDAPGNQNSITKIVLNGFASTHTELTIAAAIMPENH